MNLYLDEAGHTGKHLFDAAQPLFVLAGVWLDTETEALTKEAMARAFGENAAERKGSRLIRSSPGRRLIRDCLKPCMKHAAPVSVYLFNKAFQAAAVVVEDCTDYVYNEAFEERWTWDTTLKEPLAQRIYNAANRQHLMDVWRTRLGSQEEFLASYDRLLLSLRLNSDRTLSDLAGMMRRADFASIWQATQSANASQWAYSPNLNAFVGFIQAANRQAIQRGLDDVLLVHDEQLEYQAALSNAFGLFRNAKPGRVILPNGNVFQTPLSNLRALSFAASTTEIGLQAADMVAACMRLFAAGTPQGGPLTDVARWVLAEGDNIFPIVLGPTDWQMQVFRHILAAAD